jgi:hypothetical protein
MRRITFSRSDYLPAELRDAAPAVPEGTDLAIWTWEHEVRTRKGPTTAYSAVAFAGKSNKPLWNHWFRTADQRHAFLERTVTDRKATLALKRQRAEERRNYRHDYKPGDILVASWGYDQTNVDFYEVVGVRGAIVELREVGCREAACDGPISLVVPSPRAFLGPVIKRRPGVGGYVRIDDVRCAHKWAGKPQYRTASGWER